MLNSPIRLVGTENGEDIVWSDFSCIKMTEGSDTEVTLGQTALSNRFVLNTSFTAEYDGFMDWKFSIMPQGRTVRQCFGLDPLDLKGRELTRLWLEIPLRKEFITNYHIAPIGDILLDGKEPEFNLNINRSGFIPTKSIDLGFKHQVFLGNDDMGFAVLFDSDKNWQPADKTKTIECIIENDEVLLRIHLLDSEPKFWEEKGTQNGNNLIPISFRVCMQATPIKPFPKNPHEERSLHIDCFKKIPQNYEDFLFEPYEGTGEITFDRIERLGVKVLYLHEKWNDLQNSVDLTEKTSKRLEKIITEAHKRGIKVIPYFGFEMSSLSPNFYENVDEYMNKVPGTKNFIGQWYRQPWQKDVRVCYKSEFTEHFVKGIEFLIDKYHFDGIYLDGTIQPTCCENEKHGCGYRDVAGNLHATYSIFSTRTMMKRLYEIIDSRGGTINAHTNAALPVSSLAFVHSVWEGEGLQAAFFAEEISEVPEGHFRTSFSGRNVGVPTYTLCYSNPPDWTFTNALASVIPLGVIPKPVDTGEPLEEMSRLWNVIDSYPIEDAKWNPYFKNNATISCPTVKVSYYDADGEYLIIVANFTKKATGDVKITLPFEISSLKNAITNMDVPIYNNSFTVNFNSFEYLVLLAYN